MNLNNSNESQRNSLLTERIKHLFKFYSIIKPVCSRIHLILIVGNIKQSVDSWDRLFKRIIPRKQAKIDPGKKVYDDYC